MAEWSAIEQGLETEIENVIFHGFTGDSLIMTILYEIHLFGLNPGQ